MSIQLLHFILPYLDNYLLNNNGCISYLLCEKHSRPAPPRLASPRLASPRLASPRLVSSRLVSSRLTMDVVSLYTNILHKEGINGVAKTLEKEDTKTISTRVIVKFLSLILNLNNFTFNDENYLQIKGCAMGGKCSSTYGNIYMGTFDEDNIYSLIANNITCYYRFIDSFFSFGTIPKPPLMISFYNSSRYIRRSNLSANATICINSHSHSPPIYSRKILIVMRTFTTNHTTLAT